MLRHAYKGTSTCSAATDYRRSLVERHAREAEQLASLTGWTIADIRKKMGPEASVGPEPTWWERLWK